MPIYEYRCQTCDQEFEKLVTTAGTAVQCPACGTARVMRRLSLFQARREAPAAAAPAAGAGGCCAGGCTCR